MLPANCRCRTVVLDDLNGAIAIDIPSSEETEDWGKALTDRRGLSAARTKRASCPIISGTTGRRRDARLGPVGKVGDLQMRTASATRARAQRHRQELWRLEVIHGIDLTIEEGDFVVFVGPSGCGKSTLLRMIAGLEEVTEGRSPIKGRDVTDLDPPSAASPWSSSPTRSTRI